MHAVFFFFFLSLEPGKMMDCLKCLECGTEKTREDTFLDIPLSVRPFGSSTAYGSVVGIPMEMFLSNDLLGIFNLGQINFRLSIAGRSTESFCCTRSTRRKQSVFLRKM